MRIIAVAIVILLLFGCTAEKQMKSVTYGVTQIPREKNIADKEIIENKQIAPINAKVIIKNKSRVEAQGKLLATKGSPVNEVLLNESESYMNLSGGGNNLVFGKGDYRIILVDISLAIGDNLQCGMFTVLYTDDNEEIKKLIICPEQEYLWVSPKTDEYRIKVINTAAGYTKNSRWASVIIYS